MDLDDVLIARENEIEHFQYLDLTLKGLDEYGLIIKPNKYILGHANINFLGRNISGDGIRTSKEKVIIIRNFEEPKSVEHVQKFMRLVHFYHRYIPMIAETTNPIHSIITNANKDKEKN